MDTIAARIRRALEIRGWSARDLSARAGLSASQLGNTLARIEKRPDAIEITTVRKIAGGLGVSTDWLLTGLDDLAEEALRAPRFGELPGWGQLVADARAITPAPDWVWTTLGESRPILDGPPTAGLVADLAVVVLRHGHRPT